MDGRARPDHRTLLGRIGRGPVALFTVALAIRLVYIFAIAPEPIGVGGDASFYHSAANLIAQGHFYYRRIFGHAYATALHPPLYSLLLAPVALLGGVHLLPQRIVGCVLGAISVALMAVLGRRIGRPRAGLAAGAIAAFYPQFVTADGSIQSEPLYVLLLLVSMLAVYAVVSHPTVRRSLVLGAVIGLGVLARTEALFLLPLLGWPAAWVSRAGRWRRLTAVTVATALILSPWVIRNAVVFHRLMLAGNYNTVVAAANCPTTYYGYNIGWWSVRCLARARTRAQFLHGDASPTPGLRYARKHAGRALLVAGVRVLRTFSFYQPLRIGNHEPRRRWVDVLGLVIYYPVLLLAAAGLTRVHRRRWLLMAPIWTAVIVSATGWGNPRFRIGADVALVLLAGIAVTTWRRPSGRAGHEVHSNQAFDRESLSGSG